MQAVFSDGPVRYVLVPEGGRYVRRPVNLGRRSDLNAQIIAGLDEGDRVLLRDPQPGEVIDQDWDEEQLVAAGYSLDDEGNPIAPIRSRPGRGGPGRGGPPANAQTSGDAGDTGGDASSEDIADAEASTDDTETADASTNKADGAGSTEADANPAESTEAVTEPATDPAG